MATLLTGLTVVKASSFVAAPSAGLYPAQLGAFDPLGVCYGPFGTLSEAAKDPDLAFLAQP